MKSLKNRVSGGITGKITILALSFSMVLAGFSNSMAGDGVENVHVRGVPALKQHSFYHDGKGETVISGCGAVAMAGVLMWYYARGWTDLLDDYVLRRGSDAGKLNWQNLTQDLGRHHLDTVYGSDWEWDGYGWSEAGDYGMTYPKKILPGVKSFVEDRGYSIDIEHHELKSGDEDGAYERIKHVLKSGRPIILGFDYSTEESGELKGGGIGGGGDNWSFIDHYALITGFREDDSSKRIYVTMGQGSRGNYSASDDYSDESSQYFEFEIGSGQIHLWYVKLSAGEKSMSSEDIWCPADEFEAKLTDTDNIGYSNQDSKFDDFAIQSSIISGTDCAVIEAD